MSLFMHTPARVGFPLAALALLALASCASPPAAKVPAVPDRKDVLLRVHSTPSGARIILNGKPTGFRTPTSFPVSPGEHRVTISLAGHRNADLLVRLEPGETRQFGARLTPLASGALHVTSQPEGALIFVDGDPVDRRTPAVIENLVIGTHTVELRQDGYEDWCQAVVIIQERTLVIQAALAPSRHSRGALLVLSHPPGAAISIDGNPTGKLTPQRISGLTAGSHRVDLALQGYRDWSGTTFVREGQTEHILVALRHLPAPEAPLATDSATPGDAVGADGRR